jgi:predicted SAM-dependent methyltransferase
MLQFVSRISADRSIWSYSKVQRLVSACIRGQRIFMNHKTEGLVLDIGCGPNGSPRNINLDYHWRPGVDVCCDITKGLPFKDGYVAGIFTEHCLEHISFDATLLVFREFYRVLQQGAYARIVVPDLEVYVEQYDKFRATGELSMPFSFIDERADHIYSPAMRINRVFRWFGHQFIYDFSTMAEMLRAAGFDTITKARFGGGADPSIILDTPDRALESLYVEARKP